MGWHHCGVTDKAFTLPRTGHLSQGDSKETSLCTNGGRNIQTHQGLHFSGEVAVQRKAIYKRRILSLTLGSLMEFLFRRLKKKEGKCRATGTRITEPEPARRGTRGLFGA